MKQVIKRVNENIEVTVKEKEVEKMVDGKKMRVIEEVKETRNEECWQVVRATPNSGGQEYIRLQNVDGRSFKWNAQVADYNDSVALDDPRWKAE